VFPLLCILLFLSLSSVSLLGQERSATVYGKVASAGDPVPAATVSVENRSIAPKSDPTGRFELKIPTSRVTLQVNALGYASFTKELHVTPGDSVFVEADLLPASVTLDEVVLDRQTGLTRRTPYAITGVEMHSLSKSGNPGGIAGALREIPGVSGAGMGPGIDRKSTRLN